MFANARYLLRKRIMDQIRDVRIVECKESAYVKPYRVEFVQVSLFIDVTVDFPGMSGTDVDHERVYGRYFAER